MKRHSILFLIRYRSVEKRLLPGMLKHYDVIVTQSRREAMQKFANQPVGLVLIDVPSIRFDLMRFCDDLRARVPGISIFLLLSKGMRLDQLPRVQGYLRHPFTVRQLIRRLARAFPEHPDEMVQWQGLCLDTEGYFLIWGAKQLPLTPKQAALIQVFLRSPDELVSRAWLMQEVWGTNFLGDTRTLDVHIHWLRKSLKQLQAPFVIETLRGKGYRLTALPAVHEDASP